MSDARQTAIDAMTRAGVGWFWREVERTNADLQEFCGMLYDSAAGALSEAGWSVVRLEQTGFWNENGHGHADLGTFVARKLLEEATTEEIARSPWKPVFRIVDDATQRGNNDE